MSENVTKDAVDELAAIIRDFIEKHPDVAVVASIVIDVDDKSFRSGELRHFGASLDNNTRRNMLDAMCDAMIEMLPMRDAVIRRSLQQLFAEGKKCGDEPEGKILIGDDAER